MYENPFRYTGPYIFPLSTAGGILSPLSRAPDFGFSMSFKRENLV